MLESKPIPPGQNLDEKPNEKEPLQSLEPSDNQAGPEAENSESDLPSVGNKDQAAKEETEIEQLSSSTPIPTPAGKRRTRILKFSSLGAKI